MNPGPLSWAVALQLLLITAAKWRTRNSAEQTLLSTVLPHIPASLTLGVDLLCAALLLLSATFLAGAALLIGLVCLGAVLDVTFRDRDLPCGCFGAPNPGLRYRRRERIARTLLAVEAVAVASEPLAASRAWQGVNAVLASVLLIALLPSLLTVWSRSAPLTARFAVQQLAASTELEPWRPYLLSDTPASVTLTGRRAAEVVLDAWWDEGPLLLVAHITGPRIRVLAHHGDSLKLILAP